jgi:hypothetical protein
MMQNQLGAASCQRNAIRVRETAEQHRGARQGQALTSLSACMSALK